MTDTPILSARVTPMPPRRALWARLRLFSDRLELRQLTWGGFCTEVFRLDDLTAAEWWSKEGNSGETNFSLGLSDGTVVPLRLQKGAGLWHTAVMNLRPDLRETARHPGEAESLVRRQVQEYSFAA